MKDKNKGVLLEDLTWLEAEECLTPSSVVVIPLGAAAKEHGPHLKLKNDWLIAEYLKNRVLEASDVVMAPTVNYSFYPAFVEYPGSISIPMETARDTIIHICKSLSNYGPKRFYVLNTGVSTMHALKPAAELLHSEGLMLHFTNIIKLTDEVDSQVAEQEGGTHADELETSMMLYIAPETVDMSKAQKNFYTPHSPGPLTRVESNQGIYSPSGIWGDATLATKEKGEKIVEAMVEGILKEIKDLAQTNLP